MVGVCAVILSVLSALETMQYEAPRCYYFEIDDSANQVSSTCFLDEDEFPTRTDLSYQSGDVAGFGRGGAKDYARPVVEGFRKVYVF